MWRAFQKVTGTISSIEEDKKKKSWNRKRKTFLKLFDMIEVKFSPEEQLKNVWKWVTTYGTRREKFFRARNSSILQLGFLKLTPIILFRALRILKLSSKNPKTEL